MDAELAVLRRCISQLIKEFDYQKKELGEKPLKELISIVRGRSEVIPAFVDALFEQLRRDDCDVRLGALFIANHFFQRSHGFRLELINSLQDFLVYTLETNPLRYPLPKPADAAKLLKQETLSMMHCWIQKFGAGYPKLEKLQHFLKNSKIVDWEGSRAELLVNRERESRERFEREIKARKTTENISNLYGESRLEIERAMVEAHNIVEILFPKFCPLEFTESEKKGIAESSCVQNNKGQLHGFGTLNGVSVCINTNGTEIDQSVQNVDLLNQLKDTTKQLEKWHAKLGKWLKKLAEIGDSSAMMRRMIDLRHALGEDLQKCIEFKVKKRESDETDSDDSDFVDVEAKEGYEPNFRGEDEVTKHNGIIVENEHRDFLLHDQPGPSSGVICRREKEKTKPMINEDRKSVPKLAMGLDLKYWGQDKIEPAEINRKQEGHSFWSSIDENPDDALTENMEAYKSRQITFVGKMPEIRRRCRAPLPSGKLCPRMEYAKCALHGPIIDRDEMGFPTQEQKNEELLNEKRSEKERQEEMEYCQDVEAVTGVNLTVTPKKKAKRKKKVTRKKKGKKGKKKKTARKRITPKSVKSRERLVAKLFDKQTLKRVTKTLEQMQKARSQRKFSNQFNYAIERR